MPNDTFNSNSVAADASSIRYNYVTINEVITFYREAGSKNNPVLFLLHGYPSSSFMFRNLIPLLAEHYWVIAPDLPGFGFTEVPNPKNFQYTFAGYADFIEAFLGKLNISKATFYLFDYGAPILMRIIERKPSIVETLIFQNGNIYREGLGEIMETICTLLDDNSAQSQLKLQKYFELNYTRWGYLHGVGDVSKIAPETFHLDQHLLNRKGLKDIHIALKEDYKNNIALYPQWQKTLKRLQPPTLIIWGENDELLIKQGAYLLHKDIIKSKVILFPTGHFALEEYGQEIGQEIINFKNAYQTTDRHH